MLKSAVKNPGVWHGWGFSNNKIENILKGERV